jgi:hypothetical protein
MKLLPCLIAIFLFLGISYTNAQSKTYTIPPGGTVYDIVPPNEIFLYPSFVNGTVYYRSGGASKGMLNYNTLISEMQYVDGKGDTLALANESSIKHIIINSDTFYYDKAFVRVIGGNNKIKLGEQPAFVQLDITKVGGYDQATSSSSISSLSSINVNGQTYKLTARENMIIGKTVRYYIGDVFNDFLLLNKKNLYKMFGKYDDRLRKFLKEAEIDFNKKEDVQRLIVFLQTLN